MKRLSSKGSPLQDPHVQEMHVKIVGGLLQKFAYKVNNNFLALTSTFVKKIV